MGWWKISGTDDTIGDDPLEALEVAVAEVLTRYQEAFGRRPRRSEWESLLRAVLGSATADERVVDDGIVVEVQLKVNVQIVDGM